MKGNILSTLNDQSLLAAEQRERKRQITRIPTFRTSVGARKRKILFSLSPINSRKKGRKEGKLFLSSPIYRSKWGAINKKPAGVIGVDFF